jgi:hypothetical protein
MSRHVAGRSVKAHVGSLPDGFVAEMVPGEAVPKAEELVGRFPWL